jgi:hypothetical protein
MQKISKQMAGFIRKRGLRSAQGLLEANAPFSATKALLQSKEIKEALATMQRLPVKKLAATIKSELPPLADSIQKMIPLIRNPAALAALAGPDEETLSKSGWKMLSEVIERTAPVFPWSKQSQVSLFMSAME